MVAAETEAPECLIEQAIAQFRRNLKAWSREGAFGSVTLHAHFNGGRLARVVCDQSRTFADAKAMERAGK